MESATEWEGVHRCSQYLLGVGKLRGREERGQGVTREFVPGVVYVREAAVERGIPHEHLFVGGGGGGV